MSRALPSAALFAVLAACGGDDGGSALPDARTSDAPALADAPPSDCQYVEQNDDGNDDVNGGTPETTGLSYAGMRTTYCGTFQHTHYDGSLIVDVDSYKIDLPADADVLVRIHGLNLEAVPFVGIDVYPFGTSTRVGGVDFYGTHGVGAMHLPAGSYELSTFALAEAALTQSYDYKVEITVDVPDTRCPEVTTGGHSEATDNGANDVFTVGSGGPALSASTTDAPEDANIVVDAPNYSIRIAGNAADIATADQYEDKDTYIIATSGNTNELTVRLDWQTAGANLDWFLFEQNTTPAITRAVTASTTGPEMKLYGIKPNSTYWLMVGAKAGTTVPAAYNVTLCGGKFIP